MNRERFAQIAQEFQEAEQGLLGLKRDQYASNVDVLENFKTLSTMTGLTPAQAASVLLSKHVQAITKQVARGETNWTWFDGTRKVEGMKQRIADARNYLLLLAACIDEEATPKERVTLLGSLIADHEVKVTTDSEP